MLDICILLDKPANNDSRVLREARSLMDQGWFLAILSVSEKHTHMQRTVVHDVPVIEIPVKQSLLSRFKDYRLLKSLTYLIALLPNSAQSDVLRHLALKTSRLWWDRYQIMINAIQNSPARVYHANDYMTLMIPFVALENPVVVYDAHDLNFDIWRKSTNKWVNSLVHKKHVIERAIEREFGQQCAVNIAVSERAAEVQAENLGVENVHVVRNMVDLRTQAPPAMTFNNPNLRTVVHVGNLMIGRQLDVLIDAFQYLPEDIALVLIGGGAIENQIRGWANSAGLGERFQIIPPVAPDAVATTMAQADVSAVLNPHGSLNREVTFPQKLFESIAAGLPVVTGTTETVSQLVQEYGLGISVDVRDPKQVAEGILTLLEPETNAHYRRQVERARETLNWEHEEKALVAIYEDLLLGSIQ